MKVYYDKDADLSLIKGKKVTIVGDKPSAGGTKGFAPGDKMTLS